MSMNKAAQVNAVALHLQGVMSMLEDFFDALVGKGQHNIVLVVGSGDVSQYIANRDRALSIEVLQGLLGRWSVGLPDTLPGDSTPGETKSFEFLLNEFQRAVLKYGTSSQASIDTRTELLNYVGRIVAESNRKAAP
jgi:hypothetical protein